MNGRTESQTGSDGTRTLSIEHEQKSYDKFQFNMSKHVGEKRGKLCF